MRCQYIGPDLAAAFSAGSVSGTLRKLCNAGGDALHANIAANTPVRTGNLRTSWYRLPAVPEENRYVSYIRTDVSYSPHVEYGTGLYGPEHRKYEIKPKTPGGMLSWMDPKTGQRVYARHVWHPGSPGAHMREFGVARTEAALEEIAYPALEEFKAGYEAQILKAQSRVEFSK